jgi:hypothetical protein
MARSYPTVLLIFGFLLFANSARAALCQCNYYAEPPLYCPTWATPTLADINALENKCYLPQYDTNKCVALVQQWNYVRQQNMTICENYNNQWLLECNNWKIQNCN